MEKVDLTGDEDRETIIAEPCSTQPYLNAIPPPLTPINTFSILKNSLKTSGNQQLPTLKSIKSFSKSCQQSSSRQLRPTPNDGTICLEAEKEGKTNYSCSPPQSAPQSPPKVSGKVVIIKKNNKYYRIVIPRNVVPTTDQSPGPVQINIPGYGPLGIQIDPQAKEQNTRNDQLEPFSLNFDEIMESASVQSNQIAENVRDMPSNIVTRRQKIREKPTEKDLLADNKFCWTFPKSRNVKSFYYKDYAGFTKAESYKARKCYGILEGIIHKKRSLLQNSLKIYKLPKQKMVNKNSQQIKIESVDSNVLIRRLEDATFANCAESHMSESENTFHIENINLPPNTLIRQIEDYNTLLPNRFLVLDANSIEEEKSTSDLPSNVTRSPQTTKGRFKKKQKSLTRSCIVQLTRDENIDQLFRQALQNNGKIDNSNNNTDDKSWSRSQKPFEENYKLFKSKIIQHPGVFLRKISNVKPLLILNEFNFHLVTYSLEFSKRNIVYAVNQQRPFPNKIFGNKDFVMAVKLGYVKLVDQDLICKFLKDELAS